MNIMKKESKDENFEPISTHVNPPCIPNPIFYHLYPYLPTPPPTRDLTHQLFNSLMRYLASKLRSLTVNESTRAGIEQHNAKTIHQINIDSDEEIVSQLIYSSVVDIENTHAVGKKGCFLQPIRSKREVRRYQSSSRR